MRAQTKNLPLVVAALFVSLAAAPCGLAGELGAGSPRPAKVVPAAKAKPPSASARGAKSDDGLEKELLALSKREISYETAKALFKLRDKPMPDELRQHVLKAAAAALLYSGKTDVYEKSVATMLDDRSEFESWLMGECPSCHGEGGAARKCKDCHGSGVCGMSNCQGRGYVVVRQINGDFEQKCGFCHGTGQCGKCGGTGELPPSRCQKCGGKGKVADKARMQSVFQASMGAVTAHIQDERERVAERREREARLEAELREREAKLEATGK